jgi:hypothetical protein
MGSIAMYDSHGLFIDGQWRAQGAGGSLEISDPATGEVIGHAPISVAAGCSILARPSREVPGTMGREGGSEGILDYMNVKLAQVVL